jgi:hypothetical protein
MTLTSPRRFSEPIEFPAVYKGQGKLIGKVGPKTQLEPHHIFATSPLLIKKIIENPKNT